MHCLDEKKLSSYLDEVLSGGERKDIEEHISRCRRCLDLLLVAYETQGRKEKCPVLLKEKVREKLGLGQKRPRHELKWFFGAAAFFVLSFVFRRFFLQFLAAAVILGFKWAMEGEGARRAIMIFKGIQHQGKNFERKSPPPVSDIAGGDRHGEHG